MEKIEKKHYRKEKTALVCAGANWGNGGWVAPGVNEQSLHLYPIQNSHKEKSDV